MKTIKTPIFMFLAVCFVLTTAGCSPHSNLPPQLVAEPDGVSLRLADAVDRAAAALETLASVEQARTPSENISAVPNAPKELMRTVSVDWTGPLEPLVQQLADRAGYKFAVLGASPPAPVVVNVTAVHRTVIDVLRDVGLQSGQRADIILDAGRGVVEVSYAPAHGG